MYLFEIWLLATVLTLRAAISIVPYGNSPSLPKPRGYAPVVDCYLRQEEVGCKGWGDHRDSLVVSVQVTAICFLVQCHYQFC